MLRTFDGKEPKIASSAFVSEAAYIVGNVEIGENSSVWSGAVIRGDFGKIRIGNNTAVEDNCVIHSG
jgi:carbonic anhydrase/acetyltransferase-like protein (isoleucine patch superfamily)